MGRWGVRKEQKHAEAMRLITRILVFSTLYVLLGNARSLQANPFIPGAVVAVNMFVPVLAGYIYGRKEGFAVGAMGTVINALSPAGSAFEFAAIIPHAIMGYAAGLFAERGRRAIASLTTVVGHALNLIAFSLVGLMSWQTLTSLSIWTGIAYETIIGAVTVIILGAIYNIGTTREN